MLDRTAQILLVKSKGIYSDGIKLFQGLHGQPCSEYTHAAVAISNDELIEAWPGGARRAPISEYDDILWTQFDFTDQQRDSIVGWMTDHLGDQYAWEDIPLIAIALATGRHTPEWIERKIIQPDRWICSAMCDAAYTAAGVHMFDNIPPAAVYPAMIADYCRRNEWT